MEIRQNGRTDKADGNLMLFVIILQFSDIPHGGLVHEMYTSAVGDDFIYDYRSDKVKRSSERPRHPRTVHGGRSHFLVIQKCAEFMDDALGHSG